jgi:hypothetical protein
MIRPFRTAPVLAALALVTGVFPAAAGAQSAGEIVSQPVRDVGLDKKEIPPVLEAIGGAPYATGGTGNCAQIASGIRALNGALGDDFSPNAAPRKTNIAGAGGAAVVNSLIPFRGLVREVSGAGAAERREQAAISAGIARRGFLRGLQSARKCRR